MWSDDPIFAPGGALHGKASPGFRLSMTLPYAAGHPYVHTAVYERLFLIFAPLLRDHCDRVLMWDRPGASARRSRKIVASDWTPFRHIRDVHDDVSSGIFTGFYFVDARDRRGDGAGPCSLRFFVGRAIRLDVSVPLDDWKAGRLATDALIAAVQQLPYFSFMAGYGLALSESFSNRGEGDSYAPLHDYARRFPAVEVASDVDRARSSDDDDHGVPEIGLLGVNWLTGVGQRFLARGGEAIGNGLPDDIAVDRGENGIVFRSGHGPASGEQGTDDATLPLYRALGARLAPLWTFTGATPRPPAFGDAMPRESLAWERRFIAPPQIPNGARDR